MSNQRAILQPGLDEDRALTTAQHLERALDEWQAGELDVSSDVRALEAFAARWKKDSMLIALRAMRRIEDLRAEQRNIDADAATADVAVGANGAATDARRFTTAENYERALDEWSDRNLDTSTNVEDFTVFASKWRLTATLISLRADRRADQLRTMEAQGRELEARQQLAAQTQRQAEEARAVEAEHALRASEQAAIEAAAAVAATIGWRRR
jgi:hypothetical protein